MLMNVWMMPVLVCSVDIIHTAKNRQGAERKVESLVVKVYVQPREQREGTAWKSIAASY